MIKINLLSQNLNHQKKSLRTQFFGALSSAFFLLLLSVMFAFLSCSPPHSEKKIRGKDITQLFFFKNSEEYKNGADKSIRFFSEDHFSKTFYEQTTYFTDTQYALKTDNGFKLFTYSDPNYYNDKKLSVKFECLSKLKFKVSRVEEIPKQQDQDNTYNDFTSIKSNPVPLKNLIYLDGIDSESHQFIRLSEPNKDRLSTDEIEQLKQALQDQCTKSFNSKYPNENRNMNYEFFLATTEISEAGFVLIPKDRVNSKSPSVYKPDLYSDKSKYSILSEIEYFPVTKDKKTLPLAETYYVQGKLTANNDFLNGKYTSQSPHSRASIFTFTSKDNTLILTIETSDFNCQKSFQFETAITNIDLINAKNRYENIASKPNTADTDYSIYTEGDLIFQGGLNKIEISSTNESIEHCTLYKKLETLKNASVIFTFALEYQYSSRSLYILMLDSDFNIVERFNANAAETN